MTQHVPLVSICIPAYRGAGLIGHAIDSVVKQTFADFELVVIDDDSRDSIESELARFADPRIRFLRNETRLGAEGNWNRCLAEARGRFVKILPQDDTLASECLQQQVAILDEDKGERIVLVFCARRIIDARGRTLRIRGYPRDRDGVVTAADAVVACVRRGTNLLGEPGAVLFRRSFAAKAGAFDGHSPYVIDLDYWFRLLAHGDAYYHSRPLASFRVSSGSWSVAIGKRQYADFATLARRIASRPAFAGSHLDLLVGLGAARVNNWLRLVFYRLFVNKVASND